MFPLNLSKLKFGEIKHSKNDYLYYVLFSNGLRRSGRVVVVYHCTIISVMASLGELKLFCIARFALC